MQFGTDIKVIYLFWGKINTYLVNVLAIYALNNINSPGR